MSRRLLTRGWVLVGCACFATVTGAASCSTSGSSSGSSIAGSTLSIYVSVPWGTVSPEEQDVLSAEKLAFDQSGRKAGKYTLILERFRGRELSDTAREAIGDATTIAYLGELVPGTSGQTLGITNAEDVLQVSPTDTALELTQSTPAISNSPDRYYESLSTNGRTFARVVPTDALEAAAVVAEMESLGVKTVYVPTDGSEYGRALRESFVKQAGSAISVVSSDATADAVFYAGTSPRGAASVFDGAVTSDPKAVLFAPSALELESFATLLSAAAQKQLYVSSPGFTSSDLPAAGSRFASDFKTAYGHAPATQAIFGYAAMAAVIHALQQAGSSAGDRATVVHDFFHITNLSTVVGSISITKNGDVTFAGGPPFVFSRVKAGRLVPVKAARG
jgi:branched-chain amino acid transport system substrate-binding protein